MKIQFALVLGFIFLGLSTQIGWAADDYSAFEFNPRTSTSYLTLDSNQIPEAVRQKAAAVFLLLGSIRTDPKNSNGILYNPATTFLLGMNLKF